MSIDIIGYGQAVKDYLCIVDEIPDKNGATNALAITSQCGGKVSTAMAAAARLGVKASMITVLGDDYNGTFVRDDFIRHGVDLSHTVIEKGKRNVYCWGVASIKSQSRMFIGMNGNTRKLAPEEIDEEFISQAKIVQIDCNDLFARELLKVAHKHGILTAIDADTYEPGFEKLEPDIDLFISSEFYYEKRTQKKISTQEFCRQLVANGSKVAIVTLGERGCTGFDGKEEFTIPAYTSIKVVDTTGAGDVFHGAYLAAYIKGLGTVESARFANAASAIKCTRIGGRAGIPDWEMVKYFMKTGEIIRQEELDARVNFYARDYEE